MAAAMRTVRIAAADHAGKRPPRDVSSRNKTSSENQAAESSASLRVPVREYAAVFHARSPKRSALNQVSGAAAVDGTARQALALRRGRGGPVPLRQQRARHHSRQACEQSAELRRNERIRGDVLER